MDVAMLTVACRFIDATYSMRSRDHWGVWLTKEGWRYEGYAVDNHFDIRSFTGECHVTCPTGAVYVGTLTRGQFHGFGRFRDSDGAEYEGEWQMGERTGHGSFVQVGAWNAKCTPAV